LIDWGLTALSAQYNKAYKKHTDKSCNLKRQNQCQTGLCELISRL